MASELQAGMVFTKTMTVTEGLSARHLAQSDGVAILSTPELIRFVEVCALEGLRPLLREGQETVGTRVDIRHLAATPVGMQVTARTTLIEVDRRRLGFTIEVHDELDKVAEGTHERFIVDQEKQKQRLREKLARWKPQA